MFKNCFLILYLLIFFTSSTFNIKTRRSYNAWRPLGYISKDYEAAILHDGDGNTQEAHKKECTRIKKESYHWQLFIFLSGIQNVQHKLDKHLQNVTITINNQTVVKNVLCPILFVICDMSAADDLCLHKKTYNGLHLAHTSQVAEAIPHIHDSQ